MKKNSSLDVVYDLDEKQSNSHEEGSRKPTEPMLTSRNKKIISEWLVKVGFILVIAYVVFLIIGAISTEYYVDEEGDTKLVVGDITVLENRDDFDALESYVTQIRDVMVDITIIDIKLANKTLSPSQAAILYKEILDDQVDLIIPKIKTLEVKTRNELIKQNIQVILSNDIAFYLQFMVTGLQQQSSQSINDATAWKSSMMLTYKAIETDMLELAKTMHRENDEFFDWELEKAVIKKDSSAVLIQPDDSSKEEGK